MTASWSPDELHLMNAAGELRIAVKRSDGSLRRWVPIWVVCAGGQVYVRTWYRRDTGWFGHALRSRRARIRVPGLEADVTIEDIGDASTQITTDVDGAYRTKLRPSWRQFDGDSRGRGDHTAAQPRVVRGLSPRLVAYTSTVTGLYLRPSRIQGPPPMLSRRVKPAGKPRS
jgi:hypothetical protein